LSPAVTKLRDYVRIDTSNPPGREKTGAEFLRSLLQKAGIEAEVFEPEPGRTSLYARLRAAEPKGKGLVLHHHIDVVPATPEGWSTPPFEGRIQRNLLNGRGVLDAKGLGIAHLEAFLALAKERARLVRDVVFLATADEETGGRLGVSALARARPEWLAGMGFALGEGGSVTVVVDQPRFFGIEIQHKGALWLEVSKKGRGIHASIPDSENASEGLARFLSGFFPFERPLELTPTVIRAFETQDLITRKNSRPSLNKVRAQMVSDPKRLRKDLPPWSQALLSDTCAVTRMGNDSSSSNSTASRAWAVLDCRLLPDRDPGPLKVEIERRAKAEGLVVDVLLSMASGPASSEGELFQTVARFLGKQYQGAVVGPDVSPGLSENGVLRQLGIETYGVTPWRVNYYDQAGIHGKNERIRTDWFDEGVGVTVALVRAFCLKP
jgi:acetylornithine deacetylase/succinyl-diaminopimelate desuccinylase-like protein